MGNSLLVALCLSTSFSSFHILKKIVVPPLVGSLYEIPCMNSELQLEVQDCEGAKSVISFDAKHSVLQHLTFKGLSSYGSIQHLDEVH